MSKNEKDCKIWVIGTNDGDVNINDTEHFVPFITNSTPEKENINILNRFLSEYVGMWYVWKNGIRSEYVGFCHYRRMIDYNSINFDGIEGGGIQFFHRLAFPPEYVDANFPKDVEFPYIRRACWAKHPGFVLDDVEEYLRRQKVIHLEKIRDYCTPKDGEQFYDYIREIYCCEWDTFCELMEFLNGYVEFLSEKYCLRSYNDWRRHLSEMVIAHFKRFGRWYAIKHRRNNFYLYYEKEGEYLRIFDNDEGVSKKCNIWRTYSYVIEGLISIFIGTHRVVDIENRKE